MCTESEHISLSNVVTEYDEHAFSFEPYSVICLRGIEVQTVDITYTTKTTLLMADSEEKLKEPLDKVVDESKK